MRLRKATMEDLPHIESLIADGRDHLAAQGIDQWQKTYPHQDDLIKDIKNGWTVINVDEETGELLGTCAVIPGPDATYAEIDGQWLTKDATYVAVHRVSVSRAHRGKGLTSKLFQEIFDRVDTMPTIESIRIDTNEKNTAMQHIIMKNGFTATGKVTLKRADVYGVKNFAYEKLTANIKPEHIVQTEAAQ